MKMVQQDSDGVNVNQQQHEVNMWSTSESRKWKMENNFDNDLQTRKKYIRGAHWPTPTNNMSFILQFSNQ